MVEEHAALLNMVRDLLGAGEGADAALLRREARLLVQRIETSRRNVDMGELHKLGIRAASTEVARRMMTIKPHIDRIRLEFPTISIGEFCRKLDESGVVPARGGKWSKGSLHQILKRLDGVGVRK